ncbi:CidA/LrgA family protein [Oceanimonas sp. NS1]|uniref:Murein hydrolase regulator LrgA n=1 Tax=Oceanimonas doudoroffii TaxID=84158 RepID=A0A233RHM5_9GAMM|nr:MULTISPECIES: CidA/LrgA family protein [Oceanimonas]MCT7655601.1 CidA/LrgA family protein [Oceanimonas sp. NS1]NHI00496.1 Antiholin-like protein LrgA [Oceanimonas sp. MB9]OXY82898.1 murein hydrolase regulator LrgA [Oceanimonas doudoroffii]
MKLIRDFAVILACLLAGKAVAAVLPFAFPASIIGLLLLFTLLSTQLVRLDWVHDGGQLILRHMALLFIPVAAGLLGYVDVLSQGLGFILVAALSGLVLILLLVGRLYQRMVS